MRSLVPPSTSTTISTLVAAHKRSDMLLFIAIFFIVFILAPLLVLSGEIFGFGFVLGGLAVLAIAACIVRWPVTGFYVVIGIVVLIEEDPLSTPILTDRLNVFYWPPALEGQIERPIGFLFIFILLVLICHRLIKRQRLLRGGELFLPFSLFLLCVAGGVVHGLTSGGNLKMIVGEIRPIWYLFVSYLLAYNLVTHKRHVRALLWIVILGGGVKAVQGVYIYLVPLQGNLTGHHQILSHEESFFFVALLLLLTLFCLHHLYRPQFYATLLILPCVLIALVANQRRADYVALALGIGVVWAIIFCVRPNARRWLALGMIICVVLGASYIIAFAHSNEVYAAPARGIVSVFQPDPTDSQSIDSNLYRTIENYDLKFTVEQNPLFGLGFGKPFLQPIPLTSIYPTVLQDDPVYNYVPHNTIYWIWMRLGAIGFFALWYLFGTITVRGSLIARQLKDQYLQLVAIYIVAIIFIEIVVAFADYQLYFYRNVIYVGLLVGVLMRLPALDKKSELSAYESTYGVPQLSTPDVGSWYT